MLQVCSLSMLQSTAERTSYSNMQRCYSTTKGDAGQPATEQRVVYWNAKKKTCTMSWGKTKHRHLQLTQLFGRESLSLPPSTHLAAHCLQRSVNDLKPASIRDDQPRSHRCDNAQRKLTVEERQWQRGFPLDRIKWVALEACVIVGNYHEHFMIHVWWGGRKQVTFVRVTSEQQHSDVMFMFSRRWIPFYI